jgi:hypothetical protein
MTGGIISPAGDRIGGSGGGRSLAEYFSRLSRSTGTQVGEITKKPKYVNSYSFSPFSPYSFQICASGLVLAVVKDTSNEIKVVALKIQRIDAIEFLGELPIGTELTIASSIDMITIKRGDFLYILGDNDKIAKVDVSNPADMKLIVMFSHPSMTNISTMDFYNGFLLCPTESITPGKLHVIDTDCEMRYVNGIEDDTGKFKDIKSIHVQGKFSICSRAVSSSVGEVIIIDNNNIHYQLEMPLVGSNTFNLGYGLLKKGYVHNETAYYFAPSRMAIVSIGNKSSPQPLLENFNIGELGFSVVFGSTVLGRYLVLTSTNFDTLGTLDINDFSSPELIEGFVQSVPYLDAVAEVHSYGQYVITIANISRNMVFWDVNGYSIPAAEIGSAVFQGKVNFNDAVRIGEELIVEKNIYGKTLNLDGNIIASNILKYAVPVHDIKDLPPLHYVEKIGTQSEGSTDILMSDTSLVFVNLLIEGQGIQDETFIINVVTNDYISISKPATEDITDNVYQIDGHIDLDDGPGTEFWIDTPVFKTPYWVKAASVESSGFGTKGESKYIYTGRGAAFRGNLALFKFFAIIGKFFVSHTQSPSLTQIFALGALPGQPATVFTENLVTFQSSAEYLNIGSFTGLNLSQTVAQIVYWAFGLACTNPYKLKPSKISFSQGANAIGGTALSVGGSLTNIIDITGFDFTPTVEGGNERFFYFDPVMVEAVADAGYEIELIGNIMKGHKSQYWASGSATGADRGLKVLGCSPVPDSKANVYIYSISTFTTVFPSGEQNVYYRLNTGFTEKNKERFITTYLGTITYTGVSDILADVTLSLDGSALAGTNQNFEFCISKGNWDYPTIITITESPGFPGKVMLTFSDDVTDIYEINEFLLIENSPAYKGGYIILDVSTNTVTLELLYTVSEGALGQIHSKVQTYATVKVKVSADTVHTAVETQINLVKNDYILPNIRRTSGNEDWKTDTCHFKASD